METQKQAKATEKVLCEFCGHGFSPYGIRSHIKACQKRRENERVDQQDVGKELRDSKAKEEAELLALDRRTLAKAMAAPKHLNLLRRELTSSAMITQNIFRFLPVFNYLKMIREYWHFQG
ncbi:uncharacterized protein LACBIDRAFT_316340 [Laccaria bicolor S238N-H82]|uniref:Predicted protein n=1 Tax=Laccaria bicolor (strain S238N-H82 / ATCC MYA-4686) TaxID=486041 RepID=B0E0R5_LACBS|nr:uncharacterized protein LACBIDRAFT_316340 [Laccaria bicolor S238N-H82]EDQ99549.1 predicted protein [Laccaria bicolor S238N-H82]|eukprot:XP_001889773.1 predicted protein [Laccaria bicolor S238N-H82]